MDRGLQIESLTFTPVADAANYTDSGYVALQGGAALQLNKIKEVWIGGQASASAIMRLLLAFDSTLGATLTALSTPNGNGPLYSGGLTITNPPVGFIASTTKPQRSSSITLAKMNFAFNAFGGAVRWQAPPNGEFTLVGAAASQGEASLSAFTGSATGPCGVHLIYETV
jgi:hypothetical protein